MAAVSVRRGSTTTSCPAARAQLLEPALHAGRGHEAAVRGHRVRAQHQQVAACGRGPAPAAGAGGRASAARPACAGAGPRRWPRRGCACAACARRAGRRSPRRSCARWGCPGRAPTALRPCAFCTSARRPRGLVERLVPADLAPGGALAPHRPAQAVAVLVQVLQRHRLGADVARLNASSASPRMVRTTPPSTSMAMPHMASHRLQVRKWRSTFTGPAPWR